MDDYEARILRLNIIQKAIDGLEMVTKALGELAATDAKEAGLDVDEAKARSIRLSRRTH